MTLLLSKKTCGWQDKKKNNLSISMELIPGEVGDLSRLVLVSDFDSFTFRALALVDLVSTSFIECLKLAV